jgi:hypothetical protein
VNDWLLQTGKFAKPNSQHIDRQTGETRGIRLLLCERIGWQPLGFSMSKESFLAVEAAFGLPAETLPLIWSNRGQYHYDFNFGRDNKVESVSKTEDRIDTRCIIADIELSDYSKGSTDVSTGKFKPYSVAYLRNGSYVGLFAWMEHFLQPQCRSQRRNNSPQHKNPIVNPFHNIRVLSSIANANHPAKGTHFQG